VSPSPSTSVHQQRFKVSGPNRATVEFVRTTTVRQIAEIGIYRGDTSELLADHLAGEGELHLFDFDHRVAEVVRRLRDAGHRNVVGHPNSTKAMDSYNWSLLRVLEEHPEPLFDYVFLDGAHTWPIDALAFLLVDRLLVPGGYVDFDDYHWSLARSPTMCPQENPITTELYTDEQIARPHVQAIVDLLVRRDPRYEEIVEDKIFRKTRA
jgi:predicted O-methyltransferase YrrM